MSSHLLRALLGDLVGIGAVVKGIRAADLAGLAEEGIAALRSKGSSRLRSSRSSRGLSSGRGSWELHRRASSSSKASQLQIASVVDLAAERLVTGANRVAALVRIRVLAALKLLSWGLCRAFSKASDFSDAVDDDFATLGLVGGADLITTFVGVGLALLESLLYWWAFGKAADFSNTVDDDFAAFGLVTGADLVAALIGIGLRKCVDSNAESEDDDGGVEDHVEW